MIEVVCIYAVCTGISELVAPNYLSPMSVISLPVTRRNFCVPPLRISTCNIFAVILCFGTANGRLYFYEIKQWLFALVAKRRCT